MELVDYCSGDPGLDLVRSLIASKPDLAKTVCNVVSRALADVVDTRTTGRYRVDDLDKTEKTYLGTRVEMLLRSELNLERGRVLDNLVGGHEVDTKFTIGRTWMIPREAMGHLCFLLFGREEAESFGFGILRITDSVLTKGENQDRKRSVSAEGHRQIHWLVQGRMEPSFLLSIPGPVLARIWQASGGTAALVELFRSVQGRVIPRLVIEQVARQRDPIKRAREAKVILASEGISVVCASSNAARLDFARFGVFALNGDEWLSFEALG